MTSPRPCAVPSTNEGGEGGEKLLASVRLPDIAPRQWHRLALRFDGARITASVDGKPVLEATDSLYACGMAGLLAGAAGNKLSMPYFDNILVGRGDGAKPGALPALQPIYPGSARHNPATGPHTASK
jgi:galactosylceramidase